MKLHGKPSYLTKGTDSQAPERIKPRITKYLYYCLLLGLLIYFLYFFGQRFFVFQYPAVVKQEQAWLRVQYGGLLQELDVAAGERFAKGDILATVGPARQCNTSAIDRQIVENQADRDMLLLEVQTLDALIQLKQSQISDDEASLFGMSRALELTAPLEIKQRLGQLQDALREMQIERSQKQGELGLLRDAENRLAESKNTQADPTCLPEKIYAPYAGKVTQLNSLIGQELDAGDALLSYSKTGSQIAIETFLDYDQYQHISRGERVTIVLPNGDEKAAKVTKIASSEKYRASLPTEGDNDLTLPKMKVTLSPVNPQEAQAWKQFELQQVTIRGTK